MSFFDKLGEFLYANTSSEYEDNAKLHEEVAIAQQQRLDQSYAKGNVGLLDYLTTSADISNAGSMTRDAKEKDGSGLNLLSGIPWYVWVIGLGAAFWYLGGFLWLKGILARNK